MSTSDEDVLRFVAASFPSVWALELLLLLKRDRRAWTHAELVAALRASDVVVNKALDALVAAGLGSLEDKGAVYMPVSAEIAGCVERAEHLYRTRPNAVRRTIISARANSASAFAAAFKVRRNRDD